MKKISIVLLVKDDNINDLRICLHNIINQTFNDFEIILLINNSLNDLNINHFVKNNFPLVKIVENNRKFNEIFNHEIKGDFVIFVESNSWLELDALEKLYTNGKNNNSELIIFNSKIYNKNKFEKNICLNDNINLDYNDFVFNFSEIKNININSMFNIGLKMYKKSFLIQNNIIPSDVFNFFETSIFFFNSIFHAKNISFLSSNILNIKNQINGNIFDFCRDFDKIYGYLLINFKFNRFNKEFICILLNFFKNFLDLTPNECKNNIYINIREYLLTLNISSDVLKDIEYNLSSFYINCLNCKSYVNFDTFNKTIKKKIKYINKDKINKQNISAIKIKRDKKIIVSLTSIPNRSHDLYYCLHSLFNQSLKPDKIILWLSEDDFPNKNDDIPNEILDFEKFGLSIEWCENIKSYKKLLPAIRKYPNDYIVTADDDIYFPNNWLETLWIEHNKYPNCLISSRARKIDFNKKDYSLKKYANWKLFKKGVEPSFLNFPTNGAGTLFFPNSLSKDFFNQDLFTKLSPLGDDIWVWAMAVRNNTKIKVVNNPIHDLTYINPAREFNLLDESTLWSVNYIYNDFQINSVLNYFPEILKKIFHKK